MPWRHIDIVTGSDATIDLAPSDKDVARLTGLREYLAIAHDLTLTEAGEAIESFQANGMKSAA